MSSRFIPRDQLSAAVPWRLGALDSQVSRRKTGLIDEAAESEQADALVNQARDEGFRHGLEVGFSKGYAAGEACSMDRNQQFAKIFAGIEGAVAALDDSVADEIIKLAMELGRQMVGAHLDRHPDAILPVVREALNSIMDIAKQPRLMLHPDDAEIIKRDMADELVVHNCRIEADTRIERGGVRIEDASFELDSTLPTRWRRAMATLGIKDEWLA